MHASLKTNAELTAAYERNADTVYRVCLLHLCCRTQDAEDALQTTFLKLMKDETRFADSEHEKAWLIVTAANVCRDMLRSGWRKRVDMDEQAMLRQPAEIRRDETLQSVLSLPIECKTAVYLYYYEGYPCEQIARLMQKSVNSVWGYLHRGRALLRQMLKEVASHAE